jgi:hypothetical protein
MSDRAHPGAARESTASPDARFTGRTGPDQRSAPGERALFPDAEVAEVVLLLPARMADALERVAHRQGLTVGQLLRHLLRDLLARENLARQVQA